MLQVRSLFRPKVFPTLPPWGRKPSNMSAGGKRAIVTSAFPLSLCGCQPFHLTPVRWHGGKKHAAAFGQQSNIPCSLMIRIHSQAEKRIGYRFVRQRASAIASLLVRSSWHPFAVSANAKLRMFSCDGCERSFAKGVISLIHTHYLLV